MAASRARRAFALRCPLGLRARCAAHRPCAPRWGTQRACDTNRVTNLTELCAELQATWHRDIPPAAAMAVTVADYDGHTLTVRAPLAVNRNLHGTAFAGSLFSVCVLTGWGATWLALRERALAGTIVVADSEIKYRKAVVGDIVCRCAPTPGDVTAALAEFPTSGRASLPLSCTIESVGKLAVAFEGTYVVRAPHR
jgi:thioesterase domain-containing protein